MEHPCILIIEDEPDIREITKLFVHMQGHQAITAENGKEAMDLLEKGERPCLILLDLMMPVMDGWAFAEEISHNESLNQVPIVVVTAFADDVQAIKNARAILKKPVGAAQLKKIVESYCGKP
jgi:CheY-like chemotaxis protein